MLYARQISQILAILIFSLVFSYANARGTDLKFQSVVSAVSQTDSNEGTVTVSIHGLDIAVVVNGDTEIEESGEEVDLAAISAGDFVEVNSFLSDLGVVADEIKILEERTEQFRFRGTVTNLDVLGDSTLITVMGVEIELDASTEVRRRGTGSSDAASTSDIVVGDTVNVRGGLVAGKLLASRLHLGTRDPGNIELEGEVLSASDTAISLQLESGGAIEIVIDENTVTSGDPAVGAFVEIEGQLRSDTSLIAFDLVVDEDGDGDADDDNRRGSDNDETNENDNDDDLNNDGKVEIGAEVRLESDSTLVNGKVETRYRVEQNEIDQNVEVEVEDAEPGSVFAITVFFGDIAVDFGMMTADELGNAEAEFETNDGDEAGELSALLPAGTDVRDITVVQVSLDGDVILEAEL